VSLIVTRNLDPQATLEAVGLTPRTPVPLLISSVGVFPGEDRSPENRVLFLVVVANRELLREQHRVSQTTLPLAEGPWEHFDPGGWTAHLTLGFGYSEAQLGEAIPLVLARLPLVGSLNHGGVEDGSSGESWPSVPEPEVAR
jgi:2'-5' RNA ligase